MNSAATLYKSPEIQDYYERYGLNHHPGNDL
jgi:hypothetical protein